MLQAMKPKGRYNARLALRKGVEVSFSSDPQAAAALYSVLETTALYHDFRSEPQEFFMNLARGLLPTGDAEIVLARYRGMLAAAAFVVYHGGRATFLYGGHAPFLANRMASEAMHWEIMRRAAARGCRTYDLYGYAPPEQPLHPYRAFSRFKEKLGGRAVRRMGSRDILFYDRIAVAALETALTVGGCA
jgi:lipid II:glycine glycyltransferase (peptidoglycan interpeptide bridge formation enzyme)